MDASNPAPPGSIPLIRERLVLLSSLAESLQFSRLALAQNDVEAIGRGAAHQAELCRQWSCLEDRLRLNKGQFRPKKTQKQRGAPARIEDADDDNDNDNDNNNDGEMVSRNFPDPGDSARLQAEWERLSARIRYLTRVHGSLLRHLQRSLDVLSRVVAGCANTYTPGAGLRTELIPLSGPFAAVYAMPLPAQLIGPRPQARSTELTEPSPEQRSELLSEQRSELRSELRAGQPSAGE